MPQFERRLYEPPDDARAFDSDEDIEDEGSRLPLLIGIALVVLLSFAGVVWLAYTQGVERGRADTPRIVAANDSVAVGRKPPAYSRLRIYQSPKASDGLAGEDESAPPPARTTIPNFTDGKAPAPTPKPEVKSNSQKPAAETSKSAAPLAAVKTPEHSVEPATGAPRIITPASPAVKPAKPPFSTVKPPAAAPSPTAPKSNPDHAVKVGSQSTSAAIKLPAKATPSAPIKVAPVRVAAAKATPAKSTPEVSAAPKLEATTLAPKPPPTASDATEPKQEAAKASGGFVLQIGSYKSDAEANASWQTYKGAHSSVASYSSDVRKVELGAKGTWYRLRIGPFASLSEANAACVKLKAQGGNCFPAKQ